MKGIMSSPAYWGVGNELDAFALVHFITNCGIWFNFTAL